MMSRSRILTLAIALVVTLAAATSALSYWQRRPMDQALVNAVKSGDAPMVRLLLLKGADPGARDPAHLSLATCAMLANRTDIAELLLSRGAPVDAEFCLQEALDNNRTDQILPLLKRGAHATVRSRQGATALHVLASGDPVTYAELLNLPVPVDLRDSDGATPLAAAAAAGNAEVVKLLLQHRADSNARDNAGRTPLASLVSAGPPVPDQWPEVINLLLAHGADLKAIDNDGNTILKAAADHGSPRLIQLLIDHGLDVNAKDRAGDTGMIAAVRDLNGQAVDTLLSCGADPNIPDRNGRTPLMLAATKNVTGGMWGAPYVVQALLNHQADVRLRDPQGQTAYDLAKRNTQTAAPAFIPSAARVTELLERATQRAAQP